VEKSEIRIRVPRHIKDKVRELAAASWRDETAQLCYMIERWDDALFVAHKPAPKPKTPATPADPEEVVDEILDDLCLGLDGDN